MQLLNSLEKSLRDLYKNAPALPTGAKKVIIEWMPWVSLVFGILTVLAAYWLWSWAHAVNSLVNSVSGFTQPYATVSRFSFWVWLGIILLIVQGVIMIAAYSPLKARRQQGWDLLFYSLLINVLYGLVVAFTDYGVSHLISSLLAAAIGLYFLYQIRYAYLKKSSPVKKKS